MAGFLFPIPEAFVRAVRPLLALSTVVSLLAISPPANAATGTTRVAVCKRAPHGRVGCFAIRVDRYSGGRVRHADGPLGYGPSDLRAAYALPATASGSGTVAVVDAYDDPNAERDLAVYRAQFGLPACTSSNGCFRKVGQAGTSSLPAPDGGWAQEISLDLDMASAICPSCRLLLVEASSSSQANLGRAVNTARASAPRRSLTATADQMRRTTAMAATTTTLGSP